MAAKFVLPFVRKEQVAKDTFSFFFDRSANPEFAYLPGQYIRMILPHEDADDRGTSRFFTVASSPHLTDHLMITTKIIQSTFKRKLFNLQPGDEIQFLGPFGSFLLDENEAAPHIYLAGGIGLTPFHSMLAYSAAKQLKIPQTLFVSFTESDEMVFYDELGKIDEKNAALKAVYTITHPAESMTDWSGETGRVSEEMIKKHITLGGNEIYFLCGPAKMVTAMREMVQAMGIQEEQIRAEDFSGY